MSSTADFVKVNSDAAVRESYFIGLSAICHNFKVLFVGLLASGFKP